MTRKVIIACAWLSLLCAVAAGVAWMLSHLYPTSVLAYATGDRSSAETGRPNIPSSLHIEHRAGRIAFIYQSVDLTRIANPSGAETAVFADTSAIRGGKLYLYELQPLPKQRLVEALPHDPPPPQHERPMQLRSVALGRVPDPLVAPRTFMQRLGFSYQHVEPSAIQIQRLESGLLAINPPTLVDRTIGSGTRDGSVAFGPLPQWRSLDSVNSSSRTGSS